MDFEEVNPHSRDQSNKVVANKAKSLSLENTESSNMRLFLSLQIIHITQCPNSKHLKNASPTNSSNWPVSR